MAAGEPASMIGARARGSALPWLRDSLLAAPIFASIRPQLAALPAESFPRIDDLNRLATTVHPLIRFIEPEPGAAAPGAVDYERRIHDVGEVLTRPNHWHDALNALIWCAFPRAKRALNRAHLRAIAGGNSGPNRGRRRDTLTLFDEGGIVVASADRSLERSLREFRWKTALWSGRSRLAQGMRFFVFGHAILEKALAPYKAITGNAIVLPVDVDFFGKDALAQQVGVDATLAARLDASEALDLTPLPILGIPGWCVENDTEAFYDDAAVFRLARSVRACGT